MNANNVRVKVIFIIKLFSTVSTVVVPIINALNTFYKDILSVSKGILFHGIGLLFSSSFFIECYIVGQISLSALSLTCLSKRTLVAWVIFHHVNFLLTFLTESSLANIALVRPLRLGEVDKFVQSQLVWLSEWFLANITEVFGPILFVLLLSVLHQHFC